MELELFNASNVSNVYELDMMILQAKEKIKDEIEHMINIYSNSSNENYIFNEEHLNKLKHYIKLCGTIKHSRDLLLELENTEYDYGHNIAHNISTGE